MGLRRRAAEVRAEAPLLFGAATTVLAYTVGEAWFADFSDPLRTAALFVWVFVAMLWSAFNVVRHADALADILGEPYGTLILTLATITIEVSLIAAIMLTGADSASLARDTMLAVVMIVLNGLVGLALLAGGQRHGEQNYNLQGARAYLAVLAPLVTMALVLPRFTTSTDTPTLSSIQAVMFGTITAVLYLTFLALQTSRHRAYFMQPKSEAAMEDDGASDHAHDGHPVGPVAFHAPLLILSMLPIVLLSKKLAALVDFGIAQLGAPAALGGVLVAVLVLAPEALAVLRAALANRLQRSVNICLGSALSTIGLTVPAVLVIGLVTGQTVVLGLGDTDMVLLILTLALSFLTFGGVRTNVMQGAVHIVVFLVYLVLIFSP